MVCLSLLNTRKLIEMNLNETMCHVRLVSIYESRGMGARQTEADFKVFILTLSALTLFFWEGELGAPNL